MSTSAEIRVLIQTVKRNEDRFSTDFMFELTKDEYQSLRSQIVTLKVLFVKKGRKFLRCQIGTLKRVSKMFDTRRDREDITDFDIIGENQELVTNCDRFDRMKHSSAHLI